MAILPIRTFGDPVLRTPAAPVTDIDAGIRKLVEDMIETMYDAPGVGLAAPQIGVSRRVAVFDAQEDLGLLGVRGGMPLGAWAFLADHPTGIRSGTGPGPRRQRRGVCGR